MLTERLNISIQDCAWQIRKKSCGHMCVRKHIEEGNCLRAVVGFLSKNVAT